MTGRAARDGRSPERRWVTGFWLYLAAILFIAISAYLNIPLLPLSILATPHFDTVAHFLLLGGTGYVAYRATGRRTLTLLGLVLPLGPLIVALLATLEEVLQVFALFRTASLTDLGADLSGILVFYLADRLVVARRRSAEDHAND